MKIIMLFSSLLFFAFGCSTSPNASKKSTEIPMTKYGHIVRRSKTIRHPLPKFKDSRNKESFNIMKMK